MNRDSVIRGLEAISRCMDDNREMLIELDSRNGDGDLGISMSEGFRAAYAAAASSEGNIGRLLKQAAFSLNEAAPSSLGTITTIILMTMAGQLAGMDEVSLSQLGEAMTAGLEKVMERTGSAPGEKTILDALIPAAETLANGGSLQESAAAAAAGAESTKDMLPVHGRAAYYGEKCLGLVDGGAVAGKLAFEALEKEFGGI